MYAQMARNVSTLARGSAGSKEVRIGFIMAFYRLRLWNDGSTYLTHLFAEAMHPEPSSSSTC